MNAFEMNGMRQVLQVHHTSHTSNKQVRELMLQCIGEQGHLLTIGKRRELTCFGHVIRWKGSFANTVLQQTGKLKRQRALEIVCL